MKLGKPQKEWQLPVAQIWGTHLALQVSAHHHLDIVYSSVRGCSDMLFWVVHVHICVILRYVCWVMYYSILWCEILLGLLHICNVCSPSSSPPHEHPASGWRPSYQSLWRSHHWHTTGGWGLVVDVGVAYLLRFWNLVVDVGGLWCQLTLWTCEWELHNKMTLRVSSHEVLV